MLLIIASLISLSSIGIAQESTALSLPMVGGLGDNGIHGSIISVDATGTVFTINCLTPTPSIPNDNPEKTCMYKEITLTVNPSASQLYANFAQPPFVTAKNTCNYVAEPTPAMTCTQSLEGLLGEDAASMTGAGETPAQITSVGVLEQSGEDVMFALVTITAGLEKLATSPTSEASPSASTGAAVAMRGGVAGFIGMMFAL